VVRMLSPITPHITQVLWEAFGHSGYVVDATWPAVDKSALTRDSIEIVVQVNGKLRGKIEVAPDASKDSIEAAAKEAVAKHLEGVTLRKLIVVPGKLVSIVAD
ncbi:MAG: class I tRNA ligase family protein, partial [Venatoribacter sp.]